MKENLVEKALHSCQVKSREGGHIGLFFVNLGGFRPFLGNITPSFEEPALLARVFGLSGLTKLVLIL